ncbi:hypothetical protein [Microcella sp.]|uniref:hypothetical protein n=1 Tax=Microcella sp. TaxID=1913979 RepID=UPI00391D0B50
MHDDDVATLLRQSDPAASIVRTERLGAVEVEARSRAAGTRMRRRRLAWMIPSIALAGGLTAITAGTTLENFALSRPPFFGLAPDEQRPAVGARFVPQSGQDMGERCLLFPDYVGLESDELRVITGAIESGAWEAPLAEASERALRDAGVAPLSTSARSDTAHDAEIAEVNVVLRELSKTLVPSLNDDDKYLTAFTITCREGLW